MLNINILLPVNTKFICIVIYVIVQCVDEKKEMHFA